MAARELLFAVLLLIAAGLVTVGAWRLDQSVGLIVGGILLAGWSWLLLGDIDEQAQ